MKKPDQKVFSAIPELRLRLGAAQDSRISRMKLVRLCVG